MSLNGSEVTQEIESEWVSGTEEGSSELDKKQLKISKAKKQNIDNRIAEDDKYLLILK